MSEVRDELRNVIFGARHLGGDKQAGSYVVADAILARFEVTPRPAVTAEELGRMVATALPNYGIFHEETGKRMFELFTTAGLRIVREEREQG